MKKIIAGLILAFVLGWHGLAGAACTTQTYTMNGRTIVCVTCCYLNGMCNTTCT